jgi:deoxycytidylate deaminase
MNVRRHIELLKIIAEDVAPVSNAKLAAAVIYRGKIVSIGTNQAKSHPFAAEYSKHPEAIYLHAETDAIYKAKKKLTETELKKSTLIIVRVKSTVAGKTEFGISKPCAGCSKCIADHQISTVIYTENSKAAELKYVTIIC